MKLSKRNWIALSFVVVALSTGIIIGFAVNSIITHGVIYETQERVKEALNGAQWFYAAKINEIDRAIYLTSIRYILRGALERQEALLIKDDMKRLIADYGLDFLTLVDKKGIVLLRFHNPSLSGDSLIRDPFIREALKNKGISGTQVLSRSELLKEGQLLADRAVFNSIPTPKERPTKELKESSGMVLKSAHPVIDVNGKVLGALMGGILLNRNYEIVDRIKTILFKDAKYNGKEIGTATIFLGDVRISTNVIDREGNRATGTRAMKEVEEQVLEKGLPWVHRAFVVDDWYITAYEPIRDIKDKIVGMLYVGILENKYVVLKERLILLFMLGMLIAVLGFSTLKLWKKNFGRIFTPARRRLPKRSGYD
jgi:two-component system NtrC family sensor kinase